jgi:hypothetical protein
MHRLLGQQENSGLDRHRARMLMRGLVAEKRGGWMRAPPRRAAAVAAASHSCARRSTTCPADARLGMESLPLSAPPGPCRSLRQLGRRLLLRTHGARRPWRSPSM